MSSRSIEQAHGIPADDAAQPGGLGGSSRPGNLQEHAARGEVDWDRIHAAVQTRLEELGTKISAAASGSLSRPGRTVAPAFALFSHHVFFRASLDEDDPILVGVTIRDEGACYRVVGEIVGEETGRIHFEEEFKSSKDSPDWINRVILLADRLAASEALVLAAMAESGD